MRSNPLDTTLEFDSTMQRRLLAALPPLFAAAAIVVPQEGLAEVYKCIDANGAITYTNDKSMSRGCKALSDDQPVSSIPTLPRRAAPSAPAAGSGDFPRVNSETQRARDNTRRQVLEKELADEEAALAAAKKTLAEEESVRKGDERNYQKYLDRIQPHKDKVEMHQRNIEALKKEIGNLK